MPYFKCVPCKIRVSAGAGTALTEGPCPGCGLELEPVVELTEVMGFRSPTLHDSPIPPRVAGPVAQISDYRGALAPRSLADAVAKALPAPS